MNKILIEDIEKEPNKIFHYEFDEFMEEFNAEIQADLEFKSIGEFIEVSGEAIGKLQLVCDRCLSNFDYDLDIEIEETYAKHALQDEYSQEFELQRGQFITDLNGEKEINVYDLLYQSVILQLPNKKVCGINCNEGKFVKDDEQFVQDERMAVFKTIQIENK